VIQDRSVEHLQHALPASGANAWTAVADRGGRFEATDVAGRGGGTRTPDTRIMIPSSWVLRSSI